MISNFKCELVRSMCFLSPRAPLSLGMRVRLGEPEDGASVAMIMLSENLFTDFEEWHLG